MSFVLRMAVRETRASWRRLVFFFVCIAIGVGSIVALRSMIQTVRQVLAREARALSAADVTISTNRAWDSGALRQINLRLSAAPVLDRTETVETPTMVRPVDERKPTAKMVELRAVQAGFPFYGHVLLQDGRPYAHTLLAGGGALVRSELLTQLNIRVGDAILIGKHPFTIRGVVGSEPGRQLSAFSLGPRVLIDYDDLPRTGLIAFGSRARFQILLRVEEDGVDWLVRQLRDDLRDQFVNVRSYRTSGDGISRDLDRAENYLSLVGLVIVVLGGIGVSSVTRVFIQQKIKSVAVMKCVGGTTRQILAVYLVQVLFLGLAGSLLGIGLARGAMAAIPAAVGRMSSVLSDVSYGLKPAAVSQGLAIGLLVAALFSLVPLLEVRHIKPALLLRQQAVSRPFDWLRWMTIGAVTAALVALTVWQAGSWRIGVIVSVGFAGLALILHLVGLGLVAAVRPLGRARSFPLRHAVLHLARPGNQTRVVLLTVGLGSFFIIGVRELQANLLREFAVEVAEDAPDLFLIDIQRDQVAPLEAFLRAAGGTAASAPQFLPLLRARVIGVQGREVSLESFEDVRGRGSLAREYGITYRDHLEPNERVVAGRFWRGAGSDAEVSIEESVRDRFKIDVGDLMRFDVLGRVITARVTSIRAVEWRDSRRGGFMFVFRPGLLDHAPQTFVAPVIGPIDPGARARLQRNLVDRFPNVSVIDIREILEMARGIVANVTLAISVVGALVLLTGGLILVGAVAMTKFQRIYEAAIFKTLGASRRLVASMLFIEYGVLGALAGTIGSLGAIVLTWGVSRYALEIAWRVEVVHSLVGVMLTTLLVTAVGVMASLDVLRRKPLATLRAE